MIKPLPEVPLVCENVENKKYYKNPYHTFHADGFNIKNQLVKEFMAATIMAVQNVILNV